MEKVYADATPHIRNMLGDLMLQLAQAHATIEALQKAINDRAAAESEAAK